MGNPDIVITVEGGDWPPEAALQALVRRAIDAAAEALRRGRHPSPLPSPPLQRGREGASAPRRGGSELSVVFTSDAEMRKLNEKWRGKDAPTNVLSFRQSSGPLLGDVILAAETVAREAALADKPLEDHMAHLLIHGYLHLLGFDHEAEAEAKKMEQLERVALRALGIPDPYAAASDE